MTANTTIRLSLDEEMEIALAKAELEFSGLKPTQIIRTVFLRWINTHNNNLNTLSQIAQELDKYPISERSMDDEEYELWWSSRKNNIPLIKDKI